MTFGLNGQTLTASAPAGGGGAAPSLNLWQYPKVGWNEQATITNLTAMTSRPFFFPVQLEGNLTLKSLGVGVSRSAAGSNLFSIGFGVYTYANSTSANLLGSIMESYSATATASVSGVRMLWLTGQGTQTGISALTPGNYLFGILPLGTATASINYFIRGMSLGSHLGQIYPGANIASTATSQGFIPLLGRYTVNTASLPSGIGQSQIIGNATVNIVPVVYVRNF